MRQPHITLTICLFCFTAGLSWHSAPQGKPVSSQQSAPQSTDKSGDQNQKSGKVELLSTEIASDIDTVDGRRFSLRNSPDSKLLVVRVGLERGFGYSTNDFVLTSKKASKKEEKRWPCIGATVRIPDGWAVNEAGMVWSLFPGGEGMLKGLGLLFVLPNDRDEVTLEYKGQTVGNPISTKQE